MTDKNKTYHQLVKEVEKEIRMFTKDILRLKKVARQYHNIIKK